jgi:endonuclease-3
VVQQGARALKSPKTTRRIIETLAQQHPNADTELHYRNAFELLVATILSAQSTDARVNMVTPALFTRYADARALAKATSGELEPQILSTGFFRQKSKALIGMAQQLVAEHDGAVPADMDALTTLPGVGRKTANVVLNIAFGEPTIAVDTHLFRVANRLKIAPGMTPLEVELGLLKVVPEKYQLHAHHWLILHGRYVCQARRPRCEVCLIADLCTSKDKVIPNVPPRIGAA